MRPPEVYNVGLGLVASSLREDGHAVDLIDLNILRYVYNWQAKEQAREIIKARLTQDTYDAVGLGTLITAYNYVKWLCEEIKGIKPQIPIWAGNSVASSIPELFLKTTKADVVVAGEGEITVKELAKAYGCEADLSKVKGIYYKKDGQIIKTPARSLAQDLDSLPRPAYDLFAQELYIPLSPSRVGKRSFCLGVSIRGCPYRCTFCYHPYQGAAIRCQSARRMIEDLIYAKSRYNFDSFGWTDDELMANRKRMYEFCELLKKEKIKERWGATARVDDISEDLLKRMKSAGCRWLGIGIESGSQKILDNIKKGVTVAQAKKALELCKRLRIQAEFSLMIGNVGESRSTIQETVAFVKEIDYPPPSFFNIATPYPETQLWDYAKSKGLIKDDLEVIRSYGEQGQKLLVNFTQFSDKELLELKHNTEILMRKIYLLRHPFYPLKRELKKIFYFIRTDGLLMAFFRGIQFLARKILRNPDIRWEFIYRKNRQFNAQPLIY